MKRVALTGSTLTRNVRRKRTHWHSKFYFPFTSRNFFEEDSNILQKYLSQPPTLNAKLRVKANTVNIIEKGNIVRLVDLKVSLYLYKINQF